MARDDSHAGALIAPDGTPIAYRRSPGAAPGIVFLCGFLSDMGGSKATALEAWSRARGQAFLRFDYSGHGASGGRFEDGTIGRWTDDALTVLDRLTEGPQILVGSSMGGWLMLLAALARPQRIAALVGIATAADFTEELLWRRLDTPARRRLQQHGAVLQPSEYSETPYVLTLRLIEEGRRHLLLQRRVPLACPVRLLHGMRDPDVPWQISVRLVERLLSDDVRVILIKDGDHRLSRESDLRLLTRVLADLLTPSVRPGST